MTPIFLINALSDRLKVICKDVRLTAFNNYETKEKEENIYRPISVEKYGYAAKTPERIDPDGDYTVLDLETGAEVEAKNPFVIIRPGEVKGMEGIEPGRQMTAHIFVGTYSKDEDGIEDAINVCELICRNLISKRVLGDYFKLIDTYPTYKNHTDDFDLNYLYEIEVNYSLPLPREDLPECLQ